MKMKKQMLMLMVAILSIMFSVTVYAYPTPSKVTIKTLTAPSYNKVKLTWDKSSNATHYYVYRRIYGSGWEYVGRTTKNYYNYVSSAKSKIVIGQYYYYMVRSYNSRYDTWGDYDRTGIKIRTLPNKPTITSVSNVNNKVVIKWKKNSGSNYMVVFRKVSGESWKKLKVVKNSVTEWTDENPVMDKKVYYSVRGYYTGSKVYGPLATGKVITIKTPVNNNINNLDERKPLYDNNLGWIVRDLQTGYFRVGYINYTYARLRAYPTTDSDELMKLEYNDIVYVEFERDGWYKVAASHNGVSCSGYVATQYVTFGLPLNLREGYVNYDWLNLREEPNENSTIYAVLDRNDKLRIRDTKDGWYYVTAEHRGMFYSGWVSGDYVKLK